MFFSRGLGGAKSTCAQRRKAVSGKAAKAASRQTFLFEPLEPRVLLSAELDLLSTSALGSTLGIGMSQPTVDLSSFGDASEFDSASGPTDAGQSLAGITLLSSPSDPTPVAGSIDVPGETDRYAFTLTEAKRLAFDSLTENGNLTWSLSGPTGVQVSGRPFNQSDRNYVSGQSVLSLPPGDYSLTVDRAGDGTGAYAFRFVDLSLAQDLTLDTPTTATLSPGGESLAYRFTANAGDRLFFNNITYTGSSNPFWRLLDANDRELFLTNFYNDRELVVPVSGTYTLMIEGYAGDTAPQTSTFVVRKAIDAATQPLILGTTVTGRISGAGDTATYGFTLAAPARLVMDNLGTAANLDWSLTGSDGTVVPSRAFTASDGPNFGYPSALLNLTAGTWTLKIDGDTQATGAFAFRLLDTAATTAITANTTVSGALSDGGAFNATLRVPSAAPMTGPGHALELTGGAHHITVPDSALLRPAAMTLEAWVRRTANEPDFGTIAGKTTNTSWTDGYGLFWYQGKLRFFVNNWNNATSFVEVDVPSETWTHVAATYDGANLRLFVNGVQAAAKPYATPINHSTTAPFAIGSANDNYRWTGGIDEVRLWSTARSASQILAASAAPALGTETGLVAVWGFDETSGGLMLDRTANGLNATSRGTGTETRVFSFTAARGDQIALDWQSGGGTQFWRLIDPSGQQIYSNYVTDMPVQTIALAGTYTLILEGVQGNATPANYQFSVLNSGNVAIPAFTGTELTFGTTYSGTIPAGGTVDFVFSTAAAAQVVFDSLNYTGVTATLEGPRGIEFAGARLYDGDRLQPLLIAGSYRLRLTGPLNEAWSVRLLDATTPTPFAYGDTVSGTTAPNSASVVYSFAGTAGDRLYFDNISNQVSGVWTLFDMDRNVVFSAGVGSDQRATLPRTGNYTLVLGGYPYSGGTGAAFSFRVTEIVDTTAPVALGAVATGDITLKGQTQSFTFTLAAPTRLLFDSQAYYGSYRWSLTGPRGSEVSQYHFFNDDLLLGLLPAGSYTLSVNRDASVHDTGPFAFRLVDLEAAPTITKGAVVSVSRPTVTETVAYGFNASAGEEVYIEWLQNSTGNARWSLLDPYGRVLVNNAVVNATNALQTLALAGRYTVLLNGLPYATETDVTARFRVVTVVDQTQAITLTGAAQTGPLSVSGPNGGSALAFSGAEAATVAAAATNLASTATAEMWIRPDGNMPQQWTPLVFKGDASNSGQERQFSVWLRNDGLLLLSTNDASGQQNVQTAVGAVRFEEWQHVAAVMDRPGGTLKLYINGVEVANATVRTGPAVAVASDLRIADTSETWSQWSRFEGVIDDLRIWTTARTASQILAGMTAAPVVTTGLAVSLPMNDATGATTLAGNGPGAVGATVTSRNAGVVGLVTGRIDMAGAVDSFTFTLAQATRLVLDSLTDDDGAVVTFTGPGGQVITRNLRNAESFEIGGANPVFEAQAGEWTVTVDAVNNRTTSYAFRILDMANAPLLTLGTPVSATLTPGNITHAYRFDGTAGDKLFFDVTANDRGTNELSWRLIDPLGRQVVGPVNLGDLQQVLTYTGTYTLLAEGRVYDPRPASYSFTPIRVIDDQVAATLGTNPQAGPVWTAQGRIGGALELTGAEDISIPNSASLNLTSTVTLEAWINPEPQLTQWAPLIFKGSETYLQRQYSLWLRNDGLVYLGTADASGEQNVQTAVGQVTPGQWTHVAGVIDRVTGTLQIYINGTVAASGILRTGNSVSTLNPLLVGRTLEENSGYSMYQGRIDEVRIWNTARSAAQILANRDAAPANTSGLVLRLALNETGTTTTATDSSPAGNNGTVERLNANGITGRISQPGQVDSYTFSVGTETRVVMDWLTPNSSLRWSLASAFGDIVTNRSYTNTDSADVGGDLSFLLTPGTYTIRVNATGDSVGWYNFRLLDLATATPVTRGVPVNATLAPSNETEMYRFSGTAGDKVFFDWLGTNSDPYIRIYDPAGNLFRGPINPTTLQNQGPMTLNLTGTYTVLVEGRYYYNSTATYGFTISSVTDGTSPMTLGTLVASAIGSPGQTSNHTFTLAGPARVVFDSMTNDGNLRWTLTGPNGTVVSNRSFAASDGLSIGAGGLIQTLPEGTYTLSVRRDGEGTGPFEFRLLDLGAATPLTLDTLTSGTLAPGSRTLAYSFTGAALDRVKFDGVTGFYPITMRIVDPFGQIILDSTPGNQPILTLPVAGIYTILIEGYIGTAANTPVSFSLNRIVQPAAGAATTQDFSGGAGQLPYVLEPVSGTPAGVVGGALQLVAAGQTSTRNIAAFSAAGTGPFQTLTAGFDLTMGGGNRGERLGAALLPAALYGIGGSTGGVMTATPNIAGAVGLSFTTWNGSAVSQVSLHWNGAQLGATVTPLGIDLSDGVTRRVEITATRVDGGTQISVALAPVAGGAPVTLFSDVFLGGANLSTARLAFASQTSGQTSTMSIDNVSVVTTAAASDATALTLGATVTGSISRAGEVDRYRFTATEGQLVLLDSLTADGNFTYAITGPTGLVAAEQLYLDGYYQGQRNALRLAAGDYVVTIAKNSGGTGAYGFRILNLSSAPTLTLDAVTSGTLDPANRTDLYRFSATAGDSFYFDARSMAQESYWRLFDPAGNVLQWQRYGGSDFGPFQVPVSGTYTLAYEGQYYVSGTANYSFLLQKVTDDTAPMALNSTVTGNIAHVGQADYHTFTLAAKTTIYLDALSADSYNIEWSLSGPNGQYWGGQGLRYGVDNPGAYGAVLTLPAGSYTIKVDGVNAATGAYSFRVLDLTTAVDYVPGTVIASSLNPQGDTALYRFSVSAGQKLFLDDISGGKQYRLIGPAGQQVFGNFSGDRDDLVLPVSGTYVVMVEGAGNSAGPAPYSFNLRPRVNPDEPMSIGATVSAAIPGAGDATSYSFTLASPVTVVFDALRSAGSIGANGAYYLNWTLTGPNGQVAGNRFQYSDSGFVSTSPLITLAPGSYTLTFDAEGDRTGTFDFRLLDVATATPLTLGTPTSGTLSPGSATVIYKFDATAGDPFFFDYRARTGDSQVWRLIGPTGRQYFMQDLSTDEDTTVLRETGTYLLFVEGRQERAAFTDTFTIAVVPNPVQNPVRLSDLEGVPGPDLQVQDLQVTAAGGIRSGAAITVAWTDANIGTLPTGAGWQDRVIVRRADTNEILADVLVPAASTIAAATGLPRSVTITLPEGNRGAGALVVTVTTDSTNAIAEQNGTGTAETNNTTVANILSALAPYADLTIEDVTVTPAFGWQEGGTVTVGWTARNIGTLATSAATVERLTIRNEITNVVVYTGTLNLASLASGATTPRSLNLTWPAGTSNTGRFVFTVEADSTNTVLEANATGTGETNNAASTTITSAPDLRVLNLRVTSAQVQSGGLLSVAWEDRNDGNATTPRDWQDRVRIVNLDTGAVLLDQAVGDAGGPLAGLAAGAERTRTASLTLPAGSAGAGRISITVTADQTPAGASAIVESNEGNNAAALEVNSTLIVNPDLTASVFTVPATGRGGSTIALSWTVVNNGTATLVSDWTDRVILSSDAVLGNGDDVVLGNLAHSGALAAGASYNAVFNPVLPLRRDGSFNLFLVIDATSAVVEPDTRANNTTGPRAFALSSPYADLEVTAVTAPPAGDAGGPLTVGWTVTNQGDSTTDAASWTDQIYLSADAVLDGGDLLFGSVVHLGALDAGGTYTESYTGTVPVNLAANRFVIIRTDGGDTVWERAFTANNVATGAAAVVLSAADL